MDARQVLILAIVALGIVAYVVTTWIRAKYGYPLEDSMGMKTIKPLRTDSAETKRLKAENEELHTKLAAMQDRMIVLEKIVTDRGYSLSEEIEALRDAPAADAGLPLDFGSKEKM